MMSSDSSEMEVNDGRTRAVLPMDEGNEEEGMTSLKQIRLDSTESSVKNTESDGEKAEDPNCIRIRVENVGDLTKKGVQFEKKIDGFPWVVRVFRNEGWAFRKEVMLDVSVSCEKSRENPVWECKVEGDFKLINHVDESLSITKQLERSVFAFDDERPKRFTTIGSLSDIIEDENFVVDGAVEIVAKIVVNRAVVDSFSKKPKFDFSSPSKYSDVILSVEGQKLHVSKQILANASRYFEALFFGDSKESQNKEIVMDEVSAEKFLIVLELIYDSGKEVDANNVEFLLELGERFDIPKVMIAAHNFLLNPSDMQTHHRLLLADEYNLFKVQGECINGFILRELMESVSFDRYSSRLKDVIKDLHHDSESDDFYRLGDKLRNKAGISCVKRPQMIFTSPSKFSDVVLVVGEKKFYASKQILAHASSYFDNLFYGDSNNSRKTEFVIENIGPYAFLSTLELIYDSHRKIQDYQVEFLLSVADRYKITALSDRAKKALYNGSTLPMHKQILLAEEFDLEVLMTRCLKNIDLCSEIVKMKNSDSYEFYSDELKIQLFERMVELSECGQWGDMKKDEDEEEKEEEEEEDGDESSFEWREEPEEEYLGY